MGQLLGKNLVQALLENLTVAQALQREVLASVVNPYVHDAGIALRFSHGIGDDAAALRVLNPEVAYLLVGVGQGEVPALGVRETGGIEVEVHTVSLGPVHPSLEMLHFHLVAVDKLSAEFTIGLMKVHTEGTAEERHHLEQVLAHLIDIAGPTRIVACGLNAS